MVLKWCSETVERLFRTPLPGNDLGKDDHAAERILFVVPRLQAPTDEIDRFHRSAEPALPQFFAPRLPGSAGQPRVIPEGRWEELVVVQSGEVARLEAMVDEPAIAPRQIAHVSIEHGGSDGCVSH